MIARIVELMHFFTDVCGGCCLAITFIPIFIYIEPYFTKNEEQIVQIAQEGDKVEI
jgi:membrane-associated phospholipid phosphatase